MTTSGRLQYKNLIKLAQLLVQRTVIAFKSGIYAYKCIYIYIYMRLINTSNYTVRRVY